MFDAIFKDKIAFVSMSTFGICGQVADDLGRYGASVVILNGRDPERGQQVADRLGAKHAGTRYHFMAADISKPAQVSDLMQRIEREYEALDVMVHAGTADAGTPELFLNTKPEHYQPMVEGLFLSLVTACRHAVPMMMKRGGGAIVALTSDGAKVPTPGETLVGGCLAASVMFVRALAVEVSRHKIRVNAVTPSIVRDTASYQRVMSGGEHSRHIFQKAESRAKLGVPTPPDVAPMITFLASSYASHITGQVISVNGGISVA